MADDFIIKCKSSEKTIWSSSKKIRESKSELWVVWLFLKAVRAHYFTPKSMSEITSCLQRFSFIILIISSKQPTCDVHVMSKHLTVPVFSLFYHLFACFQEEMEEIWRGLLQGNFQTVLMSKTSALLLSKYRLLCYNCAEIVCFVTILFV